MKTYKPVMLLACIALTCLAIHRLDSKPNNAQADKAADFGFGLQAAGVWIGEYIAYLPETTPPILALWTLYADGSFTAVSPELHGNGNPGLFGLRTPLEANWTRIGPRRIAYTGLYFATDDTGRLGVPALGNGAILKLNGVTEFEKGFMKSGGEGTISVYRAGQDPLGSVEEPILSFPMTFQWRRICVE